MGPNGTSHQQPTQAIFRVSLTAATVALAYFVLASLAIKNFGLNTPIWFANAIALTALLRHKPSAWPIFLVPVGIADALAVFLHGGGSSLLSVLCDLLEILLAAAAIQLSGGLQPPLFRGLQLGRFVLACVLAPLFSSAAGAGMLWWIEGAPFLSGWGTWYAASTLGLLIVTPFLLSWTEPELRRQTVRTTPLSRGLLLSSLLIVVAVIVFRQEKAALLFLTFPIMLLIAWSGGLLVTTTNAMTLTAIGLWFTLHGKGALVNLVLPSTEVIERIQALQLYLATALFSSLPLAVISRDQKALAADLSQAAAAADKARQEAEASSNARADFLSAMSHEIRTPLTGVLGMADLLAADDLTGKQKGYVEAIRSSGRHLLNIINDILDFSRIETGKLDLEDIDFSLPQLLERLRSLVQPMAIERGLELRFELSEHSPPVLKGDPTRLKQVLLNLVGNAIKFTERGSVTVSVTSQPEGDSRMRFRFEVRDTGIGIAPQALSQLFTAFTQADRSTSRRFGGSGLGLAISKRLVEAMGGEIGANSLPGVGSVFWFEVPLELGDIVKVTEAKSVQFTPAQPRRILVAEDVEINRALLRDVLGRQGHHLTFAENGAEAVALVEREPFDLILMDVQMPVMDGIEATRRIRRMEGPSRDIPILALTANIMAQEREKYLAAGMTECLMKPIDWQQLQAAISRYSGSGQAITRADVSVPGADQETPLVDPKRLEPFRASMSEEELASWVRRSLEDAVRSCERMATLPRGSDELTREAHSLKGTAGTFGFMRISQIAGKIEEASQGDRSIEGLLDELREAARVTKVELSRLELISDGVAVPPPLHSPPASEEPRGVSQASSAGYKILAVEDVETSRELLKDLLSKQGHHLVLAENGAQAVALVQQEPFDLILMDVQMPVMDGLEATRRIRQFDGASGKVPIVALTANVLTKERSSCFKAGMNAVLAKPIDWDQVSAAVAQYGAAGRQLRLDGTDPASTHQAELLDRLVVDQLRSKLGPAEMNRLLKRGLNAIEASCARIARMSPSSEEFVREAHSLKGSSATLGFGRISIVAKQIEAQARDGQSIMPLMSQLQHAVTATRTELEATILNRSPS